MIRSYFVIEVSYSMFDWWLCVFLGSLVREVSELLWFIEIDN